jgi:mono/diheme cytochrome c family protein
MLSTHIVLISVAALSSGEQLRPFFRVQRCNADGMKSPLATLGHDLRKRMATAKMADKRVVSTFRFVLMVALGGIGMLAAGQQTQAAPDSQEQVTPLIRSVEGPELFRAYCASCHGVDAKGAGPVAPALRTRVPDLTLLDWNNRGQFPAVRTRQMITGDEIVAAHGSREMPIWGPIFHQVEGDTDWGNVRLENLMKYLESIQSIRGSNAPSGAKLPQQH